jgi:hypothetical protein
MPASAEAESRNLLHHAGNSQDTRKRTVVIAVVSRRAMPASSWYIMWMGISIIQNCAISRQFA